MVEVRYCGKVPGIQMEFYSTVFLTISGITPHKQARVDSIIRDNQWSVPSSMNVHMAAVLDKLQEVAISPGFEDTKVRTASVSGVYTLKETYNAIRQVGNQTPWARLVWFSNCIPKHSFITRMALRRALKTQNKLVQWWIRQDSICVLCYTEEECEEHMFFECFYARAVWNWLLSDMQFSHTAQPWNEEIKWCYEHIRGNDPIAVVRKLVFNALFYCVWGERNSRNHQGKILYQQELYRQILNLVNKKLAFIDLKTDDTGSMKSFLASWNANVEYVIRQPKKYAWKKPEPGQLMVNSDGSITAGSSSFGALVRGHWGSVMAAGAGDSKSRNIIVVEMEGRVIL